MDSVVHECENLTEEDIALLTKIDSQLGLLADLSRADALMYCLLSGQRAVVVAQAHPHSILPIHSDSQVKHEVTFTEEPAVIHTLLSGRRGFREVSRSDGQHPLPGQSGLVAQEVIPVRNTHGAIIAAVSIETNLLERERHRLRNRAFQRVLKLFQEAVLTGSLQCDSQLSPFGEHDGLVVVDAQHRIQYVSGIATSLYRRLGYSGELVKRHIEELALDDPSVVREAFETGRCIERETHSRDLIWVKKAIPLFRSGQQLVPGSRKAPALEYVLVAVRDETDSRRQEEELQVKVAMIQEIHHRVKNNLQTIASLLRLQARRAGSDDVRLALQESINRIMSVAVIHEFLAHQDARVINIRDVSQRIITQFREGVVNQEKGIRLELRGPNVYLPTQPATVCALVINELLQNALEHGYERQEGGTVTVNLKDDGEEITIAVDDDGVGLPEDFDLEQTGSLGLQIVRTLAQGDLKGSFELRSRDKGVSAIVTFPKQSQGGR